MTPENDDALRCADVLRHLPAADAKGHAYQSEASAHIRRLVAENEAQAALLRQAVEALETCGEDEVGQGFQTVPVEEAITAIRQHLEGKA